MEIFLHFSTLPESPGEETHENVIFDQRIFLYTLVRKTKRSPQEDWESEVRIVEQQFFSSPQHPWCHKNLTSAFFNGRYLMYYISQPIRDRLRRARRTGQPGVVYRRHAAAQRTLQRVRPFPLLNRVGLAGADGAGRHRQAVQRRDAAVGARGGRGPRRRGDGRRGSGHAAQRPAAALHSAAHRGVPLPRSSTAPTAPMSHETVLLPLAPAWRQAYVTYYTQLQDTLRQRSVSHSYQAS